MKQGIGCSQLKTKTLLKQQLDFQFDQTIEKMIDCLQEEAKTLLKKRLDFPCDKGIETTDRLPLIQGQNIVETTVWFPI